MDRLPCDAVAAMADEIGALFDAVWTCSEDQRHSIEPMLFHLVGQFERTVS